MLGRCLLWFNFRRGAIPKGRPACYAVKRDILSEAFTDG
jgi:hypothetical protein